MRARAKVGLALLGLWLAAPHATTVRGYLAEVNQLGLPALATRPAPAGTGPARPGGPAAVQARASRAVGFALAQRGRPYRWGAAGPDAFDCSGLVQAAYAVAGVRLPRTAAAQFAAGPPAIGPLVPGDLVFFDSRGPSGWHVGLYVGGGRMVEAPAAGLRVRLAAAGRAGYQGATRPAALVGGGR